jgi:hypothetical protein
VAKLVKLLVAGGIATISFCGSVAALSAYAVTIPPHYGDNTGLGILCISIPIAIISIVLISWIIERVLHRRRRNGKTVQ